MSDKKPRVPPRWFIRAAWAAHRAIYAVSGGRVGLRTARPEDAGMMRLTTIGRRSGEERKAILSYLVDGPNLVTVAMNGWADPEPTCRRIPTPMSTCPMVIATSEDVSQPPTSGRGSGRRCTSWAAASSRTLPCDHVRPRS
jgi:hypothetical protein